MLEKEGYANIEVVAKKLQRSGAIKLDEADLNTWGYQLVAQNKNKKALQVFTLNTQLFPASANTYDSLAEAHWLLGDSNTTIELYNKVLQLQPENNNAKNQLMKIRVQSK